LGCSHGVFQRMRMLYDMALLSRFGTLVSGVRFDVVFAGLD
jgi:hypothetical protein